MRQIQMKKSIQWGLRLAILLLLFMTREQSANAQQFPISNGYLFQPHMMTPAYVGADPLNKFYLAYQQRQISHSGWRQISQFLNYYSPPLGRQENFGWGVFISNDFEHTERRLSLNGAVGAQVVRTNDIRVGVGISAGLINWGSNYDSVNVYTRSDVLLVNPSSFSDLDAGAGIDFEYNGSSLKADASAAILQLPGSFASRNTRGLFLRPHLLAGGGLRYSPAPDFFIGPQTFYRNIVFKADTTLKKAVVDLGLKAEFDYRGIWFGAGYRLNDAAVTGAFGLRIGRRDTSEIDEGLAYYLDLNMSGSYPLNESSVFGPSIEIGLNIAFDVRHREAVIVDTILVTGSFWKNNGLMKAHKNQRLERTAPPGLEAFTKVTDKRVTLDYAYDDNVDMYVGSNPSPSPLKDSLLSAVGQEWSGVDLFLENLVTEVVREGLTPDTTGGIHPDSLEPLKDLISLQLAARLKVSESQADFGARGMVYRGELGTNNTDTLAIKFRYVNGDTVVHIKQGAHITELELAALKLHSMRKKLEHELMKFYGDKMVFVWEGEPAPETEEALGKKVVYLRTLEIIPNNPNQKARQISTFRIMFTRSADKKTLGEIKGITGTDAKKRNKKRNKKGSRNRDPVPE